MLKEPEIQTESQEKIKSGEDTTTQHVECNPEAKSGTAINQLSRTQQLLNHHMSFQVK